MSADSNSLLDNFFGQDRQTGRKKNLVISTIASVEERVVLSIEEDALFTEAANQFAFILNEANIPFGADEQKKFSIAMKLIIEYSRAFNNSAATVPFDELEHYLAETRAQLLQFHGEPLDRSEPYRDRFYHKKYEPEMDITYITWQRGDDKVRQFFLFPVYNEARTGIVFGAIGGYKEIFDGKNPKKPYHIEPYSEADPDILREFREKIVAQSLMSAEEMDLFVR